jgi:hypothetical protein
MAAKKLLTGCLVVVLVLVIGAGAAWWFLLRPMWSAGSEMVSGAKDWATSLDLGKDITNQAPYDPPADGRLTPAQVAALVQVQEVVVREMGSDLRLLAERARAAQAARSAEQPPSLADMATAYRETAALLGRLKAAQAAGVNAAGLSREEYAFVRRQAIAALPLLVDVQAVPGLPGIPGLSATAPEDDAARAAARHNADLLRPHLPLLRETLGAGAAMP